MEKRIVGLFLLTILASISLVSADMLAITKGEDFTKNTTSSYFTITANSNVSLSLSYPALQIDDGKGKFINIILNPPSLIQNLSSSQSVRINASILADSGFDYELKTYTFPAITLTATSSLNSSIQESKTISFSFTNSFCDKGSVGSGLSIIRVRDENLDNDEDWEWRLLDDVEINVKVSNTAGDDKDVTLEYGLYNLDDKEFIDINEDTIDFSIDDGKSEEATIQFQVPSDLDFDSSSKDFRLYVKVYEEDDEDKLCVDKSSELDNTYFQRIQVKKESREVVVDDITLPESVQCGESLSINAELANIGRKDEDRAKLRVINRELGLDVEKEVKNLDQGDSEEISFEFNIPANATEKVYQLEFIAYFDYDKTNDRYRDNSKTTSERDFFSDFKVDGNCVKATVKKAQISASLVTPEDEVKAGKDVEIKAAIKNTGEESTNYVVSLDGNSAFSIVKSITPLSLTLEPGKSQDVSIILSLNKDAVGDYTFSIKALFDSKEATQRVSLSVAKSGISITGGAIGASIKENWFIWLIVIINIILIILIIIVAVRMSSG